MGEHKCRGGGKYGSGAIFGFFSANPLQKSIETLQKHAKKNPHGA